MVRYESQGRKEVTEAVAIAALSALAAALVNWAVESAKRSVEDRKKRNDEKG